MVEGLICGAFFIFDILGGKSVLKRSTWITAQTQSVFRPFTRHSEWAVLSKCFFAWHVFQVHAKLVTAAYSQAINLVQSKPKLAVQIAKASFVVTPRAVKIHRTILPLLEHCPTSTSSFLITVHFKFAQTIRIDFVHPIDLYTELINFCTILVNWK